MSRILVWDAPVRLFHWLLAGLFVAAFGVATLASDEGTLFPLHAVLGFVIFFLVALRVLWGLAGTRWARFGSFSLAPAELLRYLRGAVAFTKEKTYAGHNPATSWFVLTLFVLIAGLGVTGVMLGRGNESVEDLHQVLAWSVVALAGVHIAGVALHTVRRRENLAFSMIDGKKEGAPADAIRSARWGSALVLLALSGGWTAMLFGGYDPAARKLAVPIVGTTLQIGESESGEKGAAAEREAAHDDDKDNDHDEEDED